MSFDWSPGGAFGSPIYSKPITVVDGMRSTFGDAHRAEYTEQRNKALADWGLPFDARSRPEDDQPFPATEENINEFGVEPLMLADAICLIRFRVEGASDNAGWIEAAAGGVCLLVPWSGWWQGGSPSQIRTIVAHELGHALGFGHGGSGVMIGAGKVNDQERQLAAEYYEV